MCVAVQNHLIPGINILTNLSFNGRDDVLEHTPKSVNTSRLNVYSRPADGETYSFNTRTDIGIYHASASKPQAEQNAGSTFPRGLHTSATSP